MARNERSNPDLRVAAPTLEPSETFLAQLSALAAGSATNGPPAGTVPGSGWRVGLAAASVAVVLAGGAAVAATLHGDGRPDSPPVPASEPAEPEHDDLTRAPSPVPSPDTGDADRSQTPEDPASPMTSPADQPNGGDPDSVGEQPASAADPAAQDRDEGQGEDPVTQDPSPDQAPGGAGDGGQGDDPDGEQHEPGHDTDEPDDPDDDGSTTTTWLTTARTEGRGWVLTTS